MDLPIRYRRLRAPRASGEALIEPPLAEVGALIARNQARFTRAAQVEIAGQPLAKLRASAQRDLIQAACDYTTQYRELPASIDNATAGISGTNAPSILLSGHQPGLFHPGVWFKNFALSRLAKQHGAIGINLVIDGDAVKGTSIAVPTGSVSEPRREYVTYDRSAAEVAYEERLILDESLFESFSERVAQTIQPLINEPLIKHFWPLAQARRTASNRLGEVLAQGRHILEGEWGLETLELPQSQVCHLPAFAFFSAHLLAHAPRVWEHYNESLAEYRRVHHLRSAAQPLPDLTAEETWLEAPFWCWSTEQPQRRPLFIRAGADQVELTNRAGWSAGLDLTADGNAERAVEQLLTLEKSGVKLRTRALATTMFARLVLGDLFLHGIGGAKYDQVTDRLIGQLFDLEPPEYLTLTATVKLPISRPLVSPEALTRLREEFRFLTYRPERYVHPDQLESVEDRATAKEILARKERWIRTEQTPQNASTRHLEITRANTELQPFVNPLREKFQAEQSRLASEIQADLTLGSREFAFCLHEEETLRRQLLEFLHATS